MDMSVRTGAWAKSGGWVNPYPTDGLVGMWDVDFCKVEHYTISGFFGTEGDVNLERNRSEISGNLIHGLASNRGYFSIIEFNSKIASVIDSGVFSLLCFEKTSSSCTTYNTGINILSCYADARIASSPYSEIRTRLQVYVGGTPSNDYSLYRPYGSHTSGIVCDGVRTNAVIDCDFSASHNGLSDNQSSILRLDCTSDFGAIMLYDRSLSTDELEKISEINAARFA